MLATTMYPIIRLNAHMSLVPYHLLHLLLLFHLLLHFIGGLLAPPPFPSQRFATYSWIEASSSSPSWSEEAEGLTGIWDWYLVQKSVQPRCPAESFPKCSPVSVVLQGIKDILGIRMDEVSPRLPQWVDDVVDETNLG